MGERDKAIRRNETGAQPAPGPATPATTPPPHDPTTPLAYLLAQFPCLSETFILREVVDLVGRGVPLGIYALRGARGCRVHAEAQALLGRVSYRPPWTSRRRPAAYWRALRADPGRLFGLLLQCLRESSGRAPRLRRRLVALDAAVCFAPLLRARGVRHLHAHFADVPATVARFASALLGIPYSLTAHAHDIYVSGTRDPEGLAANLRRAAFVVTCTDYNRRYLAERFPFAAAKLHRVYHGIDTERFGDAGAHQRAGADHRGRAPAAEEGVARPSRSVRPAGEARRRLRPHPRGGWPGEGAPGSPGA
jgi:glycosyltransferase involved in cell wall biosynthesis